MAGISGGDQRADPGQPGGGSSQESRGETKGGGNRSGGYSGPKGFIGPSDAGLKAAGMPASPGGWTGNDDERDALKQGVAIAGTVLGALVGFPGGGLLAKAIPNRTTADRYADVHGYDSGGWGSGPGNPGAQGGGNRDNTGALLQAMALQKQGGQAPMMQPTQTAAATGVPPANLSQPPLGPLDYAHYGETGGEASFFPQSSQILTDLAQRIQKLTAKDMTKVDQIDPLTGLPKKPGAVPKPAAIPRGSSMINRQMLPMPPLA